MGDIESNALTLEEFRADWITARAALAQLEPTLGKDGAVSAILLRASNGLFHSVAEAFISAQRGQADERSSLIIVPPSYLSPDVLKLDHSFWATGDIITYGSHSFALGEKQSFFGIRFPPHAIAAMVDYLAPTPISPPNQSLPLPITTANGRAPKPEWEDIIIDTFRRAFLDNFQPQSQGELERAMLDWASEKGINVSESSVKTRARKIWPILRG